MKFYQCAHCDKIIAVVKETGVPVLCCGEEMREILPGTVDASREKHTPVWEKKNGTVTVTVGSLLHPMAKEHYIEWIALKTKGGNQRKELTPEMEPKAVFFVADDDEVEAVYAYCNLHSLWQA